MLWLKFSEVFELEFYDGMHDGHVDEAMIRPLWPHELTFTEPQVCDINLSKLHAGAASNCFGPFSLKHVVAIWCPLSAPDWLEIS